MKLLFVVHSLRGGGYERVLSLVVNNLIEKKYDITVLKCVEEQVYQIDSRVKVLCFKKKYENIHKNHHNAFFNLLKLQFTELKQQINIINPDIIISFNHVCIYPLLYLSKIKQIPLIFSEHHSFYEKLSKKQDFERFHLLKYADATVILTKYDMTFLGNRIKNKVQIYNPLTFKPITKEKFLEEFDERKKIILVAGSLNRWYIKGFDIVIKEFSKISLQYTDWMLAIAGYSPNKEDEKYLKSLCKEYNIENKVSFLGFCKDIQIEMLQSSIFILSSREEPFGMVVTEAMACGCATLSFDLPGPSEIINNGIDGLLIEKENEKALSEGIKKLIDNKDLRKNLGLNAIENIKKFSSENIIPKWEALFNKIKK